jgi:glycosyltransferase involved in cell wall biosynthesis
MTVLVISDEFPPYSGGAGFVGKQIVEGLFMNKHEVDLLTSYRVKKEQNDLKVNNILWIHKVKFIWVISYFCKLFFLSWKKYDAIILNDANSVLPFMFLFKKKVREKTTIIIQGTTIIDNSKKLNNFFYRRFNSLFERLLKDVKYVVGVSDFMSQYIKKSYPILENIKSWNPGVSYDIFKNLKITVKKDPDKLTLLTVSRIVVKKGYNEMYKLFKEIHGINSKYRWNIVGTGLYLNEFREKIKSEGYEDYIFFYEHKLRVELANLYSNADVFILLSNFEESLGLVYLEAQYFGLPVISNNKGGSKEIINKKTGYLIDDIKDAYTILINEKFTDLNADEIKANARNYSSNNSIIKLEKIIF